MNRGGMFFKFLMAAVVAIFFFSLVTMLLWNWLVPVLFGGPVISYAQALGLLVLTKILFFGIGGRKHWSQDPRCSPPQWKNRFYEKMSSLSPEDREAFKQKMRDKWCSPMEKSRPKDSEVSND